MREEPTERGGVAVPGGVLVVSLVENGELYCQSWDRKVRIYEHQALQVIS